MKSLAMLASGDKIVSDHASDFVLVKLKTRINHYTTKTRSESIFEHFNGIWIYPTCPQLEVWTNYSGVLIDRQWLSMVTILEIPSWYFLLKRSANDYSKVQSRNSPFKMCNFTNESTVGRPVVDHYSNIKFTIQLISWWVQFTFDS